MSGETKIQHLFLILFLNIFTESNPDITYPNLPRVPKMNRGNMLVVQGDGAHCKSFLSNLKKLSKSDWPMLRKRASLKFTEPDQFENKFELLSHIKRALPKIDVLAITGHAHYQEIDIRVEGNMGFNGNPKGGLSLSIQDLASLNLSGKLVCLIGCRTAHQEPDEDNFVDSLSNKTGASVIGARHRIYDFHQNSLLGYLLNPDPDWMGPEYFHRVFRGVESK